MADRQDVTRKLAAILYADVAGYSRLTGADEEGTHRTVADYLDAISGLVSSHGGRVVHYAGDAALADFPSVLSAVKCAVAIQNELAERNKEFSDDRKVQFRIGVNLGDVIVDRDDIYGNGVNVAARLEGLADPGGICLSGSVFEQVQGKVDFGFEDMGPQVVKNIEKPVQAYRVMTEKRSVVSSSRPLPTKPSIAVLPFTNVSGDPEQEYFSDGIAEDIITDLSKFDWLTVIARNASFAFKGQERNLSPIATELKADFIVDGSVRKAGNRVRITVQLVDARDDATLWAERYDRELRDIFDLQDEMTRNITAAIAPELELREIRRALGERPENLTAWDYYLQAKSANGSFDKKSFARGRELFQCALNLDSDYTDALAGLAMTQVLAASMGWTVSATDDARNSMELASRALRNNPRNIPALCARGIAKSLLDDVEGAVDSVRRATQINPNYSFSHRILARLLCFQGDYAEAKEEAELALRLSPHDTHLSWTLFSIGFVNFAASDHDEAIKWSTKVVQDYPNFHPAYLVLAAAKAESGDIHGAKKIVGQLVALDPEVDSNAFLRTFPRAAHPLARRYKTALTAAGLPD